MLPHAWYRSDRDTHCTVLPFALSHGERGKDVYGGKKFIKMGIFTLLDPLHFAPRRDRDHGGEGSVQAAAVPRLGVMVLLVPLGLRLVTIASRPNVRSTLSPFCNVSDRNPSVNGKTAFLSNREATFRMPIKIRTPT